MPHDFSGPGGQPFKVIRPSDGPAVAPRIQPKPPSVVLVPGTAFNPEPVKWLWRDWLALGKLHLLAGSPGTGKTTIGLSLAAAITRGGKWPDETLIEAGDAVVWSGEDGVSDTLLTRFLAAGGNPERIHFVEGRDAHGGRPFDPSVDMPALTKAAKDLPNLKLLLLDPVVAAVAADTHKNAETRRGLQPVVDMAEQLQCVALGITHLSKNTSGRDPLERISGSIAFGAVARVVMATVRPSDPDAARRLIRVKSNIGPDSGGFEYQLFGAPVPGHDFNAQSVDWGQMLEGSARELMAVEQPDNEGERDEAEAFLLDTLRSGPVPTKEIRDAAAAHGRAWRTVNRAKQDMGITAIKLGMKEGWAWRLPDAPKNATEGDEECHKY